MKQKNLMIGFELYHHTVDDGHLCKTEVGFSFAQLRFVISGSCTIGSDKERSYGKNTLIYLPSDTPYQLLWNGEQGAEFYVLEFAENPIHPDPDGIRAVESADLTEHFIGLENAAASGNALVEAARFFSLLAACEQLLNEKKSGCPEGVGPAITYLNDHCTDEVRIETLARLCNLSESRFYTVFRQQTGQSPINYKNALKIKKAAFMLKDGFTAEEICDRLNFCSASFFRRQFRKVTGLSPTEYLKNSRF